MAGSVIGLAVIMAVILFGGWTAWQENRRAAAAAAQSTAAAVVQEAASVATAMRRDQGLIADQTTVDARTAHEALAIEATSTAEAVNLAESIAAAEAALSASATVVARGVADQATLEATRTFCMRIDNYSLLHTGEPLLDPLPPYTHAQGNSIPPITASWTVVNNGQCPWRDLRLRPLRNGDAVLPELRQNGVLISEIGAGETAEIVLIFDRPSAVQDLDEEWIVVVASDGGDLTLIDLDHLALKIADWITIKDPTATPTLTPTSTPIPTETPVPPTPSSGGGGNGGNGGNGEPPPPDR